MALFRDQIKPKGFTRKPLYWDAEKEEREERERRIRAELGKDVDENGEPIYRPNIKGQFRSAAHGNGETYKQQKMKNLRKLLMFVVILVVLLYLVMTALPFLELFLEKYMQ